MELINFVKLSMRNADLAQEMFTHLELNGCNPRVSTMMTINTMALFSSNAYMIESTSSQYKVINVLINYIHGQAVFVSRVHL